VVTELQSAVPVDGPACGLPTLEEPAATSVVVARMERAVVPATRRWVRRIVGETVESSSIRRVARRGCLSPAARR
jgi:hypothetical protein